MKILFIVPYVPNLVRLRSFNLISFLSARGHEVSVLTLYTTESDREDAKRLLNSCFEVHALPLSKVKSLLNILLALPSGIPIQADYSWQPAMARKLKELLAEAGQSGKQFDIIHVEHLRGARYALYAKQIAYEKGKANPPVIWDSVDCISMLFREAAVQSRKLTSRIMTGFELGRTEKYEALLASQFDQVLLTSQRDKQSYLSLLDSNSSTELGSVFSVLPNGVDLDYFQPFPTTGRDPATIVVHGKMSYHANTTMVLHLAQEIMPLVWARRPDAKLIIVGKDPGREIRALAKQHQIQVTGQVDDIRPYLQRATIAAAPIIYGAGIQNKVLEAMACATPTITSPTGVSALRAVPGRDLFVAHNPWEFAYNILELFKDPDRRTSMGMNGRWFVESNHDWIQIVSRLETIYQQAIDHPKYSTLRISSPEFSLN